VIRRYTEADADQLMALNQANVPEVGPLDRAKLDMLVRESDFIDVVEIDGVVEGALVVMSEGADYPSPNYRWFCKRNPRFTYVDRIMLSPATRGRGYGKQLYDRTVAHAHESGSPLVCAEVNTEPPNPRSLRFHEVFGFAEVARERPYGPDEEVAMMELIA